MAQLAAAEARLEIERTAGSGGAKAVAALEKHRDAKAAEVAKRLDAGRRDEEAIRLDKAIIHHQLVAPSSLAGGGGGGGST